MRRFLLTCICAMALISLPLSSALALHDAGVAHCNACHTMHNSENGALIDGDAPNGNPYLLKDATGSDVCLSCHATSRGAVWTGLPMTPSTRPGGDFSFLTEDNLNDGHNGHLTPIAGSYGGHNVVAPSKGSIADPVLTHAPGGTYPSSALGCTSCHDPHGNEHFRMLYGAGPVEAGGATFTNAAPVAISQSYNTNESNVAHTGYNSGMSAWCANCHGDFHDNGAMLVHASGVAMGASIAQTYGLYNGTMDQSGGNPATAYLALVPFEDPANTTTSTAGPTASSQVSCITCHRAHASTGPNIGRWDFNITTWSEEGVESASYAIVNPYVSPNQRSLCNKCHNKDEHDENEF